MTSLPNKELCQKLEYKVVYGTDMWCDGCNNDIYFCIETKHLTSGLWHKKAVKDSRKGAE